MKYILMHKNIEVLIMDIDSYTGVISAIDKVLNEEHRPAGVGFLHDSIDRGKLNKWWTSRSIPASRMGIKDVLKALDIANTTKLIEKAYGLSLSDQYWVKPVNSELTWNMVNFFDNNFSEDVGNLLFGENVDDAAISLLSPDNTSDGWLMKKWSIVDGKRCLIKTGSGATRQEPYNEVIASAICRRLGINHIPYNLITIDDKPCSVCENFVTKDTELVTAYDIAALDKQENHISSYAHYVNCAKDLGIDGIEQCLDQMIILDYIMANEDRHWGNFGVIRNANTLEYVDVAPIFDTGTALGFDLPTAMLNDKYRFKCKPFKTKHDEQLKLVTSFENFNFTKLIGIEDEIQDVFAGSMFVDEARANAIGKFVKQRIEKVQEYSLHHKKIDNIEQDVKTNIKYSGKDHER